ncbi:hypothetical protein IKE71_03040 [Candidatus Saccharibacteria bacterium]|nr:hypothetical protein [Candidatus Saccharibacteria bacterium]
MLTKLLKLNFLWVNKFALYFGGAAIILGIASRLTANLSSVAGLTVHNTLQSLATSAVIGLVANVLARSIVHFKNTLIKDEAYLHRTLPVEPTTHWNVHVLSFLFSMSICLVAILGILALLFLDEAVWETLKTLLKNHATTATFLLLTLIFEVMTLGLSIFTATALGRRANKNRNLKMGLYSVLFYFGAQALLLSLAFALSQLFPSFANVFSTTDDMPFLDVVKNFQNLFILSGAFYALYSVILYFVGKRALKNGMDVE